MSALGISSEETSRDPEADDQGATPDDTIVNEAKRRFARCSDWETDSRVTYIEDIKFANADSDNLFQWSQTITQARGLGTIDERPCLTINKCRQHNLQIMNDARQHKPSVKIKPTGDTATYDSALVFSGVCEHIEYISNAQQAYDTAVKFQVEGGIGWWRVVTDYANDDSFDQEIFIRRVKDPLTIYMDPDIREVDGSDAKFAFVFDDMTREDFNHAYPKYKGMGTKSPLGVTDDWVGADKVRVAEYFRMVEEKDKLVAFTNPLDGSQIIERKSKLDKELFKLVNDDPETKLRDITDRKVEWFMIIGDQIADKSDWPGKYIPLVRILGEETVIEGKLDRKGHTRAMKDPQRMYNYWTSSAVEQVALQTKIPYVAALGAIEGLETYWETANTANHSVLPYNHMDDAGREMPAPKRADPPSMANAYIEGMKISSEEIREVTGQYQAELGMEGNEKSGVAIQQRQRQGDNATYHYIDNLAIGIRFTGKILIDLIPKVYDTKRVMKIMGDDGTENQVTIDPQATDPYKETASSPQSIQSIFNPSVGKYDVEAEIGPDNGTQRQEAANALMALAKADPDIMKKAGDIIVKAMDFPMADLVAERLKPGPDGAAQQAQEQMQKMGQDLQAAHDMIRKQAEALTAEKSKQLVHQEQKDIDVYKAITERLKVLLPLVTSPADQTKMAHEIMLAEQVSDHGLLQTAHSAVMNIMEAQNQPAPEPAQAAE